MACSFIDTPSAVNPCIHPADRLIVGEVVPDRRQIDQRDVTALFLAVPVGMPVKNRFHFAMLANDVEHSVRVE